MSATCSEKDPIWALLHKERKSLMMSLLSEEIPSYEALIHEEELSSINLKLIIDCVSSIPLYERLDIDKGALCENETKIMESQAKEYIDTTSNATNIKKIEIHNDDFSNPESEYSKTEDFSESFLKYLYNCTNNDELLIKLKRNRTVDEPIEESIDEVKLIDEIEFTPSKEFLKFFLNASDGKYDNFVVHDPLPSHDLPSDDSSDASSDDQVEIWGDKIKELSYRLKFFNSSNSKFLEPIINAGKFNAFEMVSDTSFEKATLKKGDIFLSDSESENYLKLKHLPFEVDKASIEQSSHQTKNDLKVFKKKRDKNDKSKNNANKNSDSKFAEKKAKENFQKPRSQSKVPIIDQAKINVDDLISSTTSTNVPDSPKQLNNLTGNIKKQTNKKTVNNETSSSGDEDWEDLAEKNLFLRSKTLGQKVAKKK